MWFPGCPRPPGGMFIYPTGMGGACMRMGLPVYIAFWCGITGLITDDMLRPRGPLGCCGAFCMGCGGCGAYIGEPAGDG